MGIRNHRLSFLMYGKIILRFFLRFISGQIQSEKNRCDNQGVFFPLYSEPMTEMPSEKGQKYKSGLASDKAGE